MANATLGAPPTQQKRPGLPVVFWLVEVVVVAFWIYVAVTGLSFIPPVAQWGLAVVATMSCSPSPVARSTASGSVS